MRIPIPTLYIWLRRVLLVTVYGMIFAFSYELAFELSLPTPSHLHLAGMLAGR